MTFEVGSPSTPYILLTMISPMFHFSDKDDACLAALDITNESHLFLWDGVQVRGEAVQVGDSCEPIQLHITHPALGAAMDKSETRETEMVVGFHKNATLREVRVSVKSHIQCVQPVLFLLCCCHISHVSSNEQQVKAIQSLLM